MAAAALVTSLHRIDLELGPEIGSGAQGQLFRVRAVKSPAAPAVDFPLIYKEFHAGTQVSGAGLAALAQFRTGLDDHDLQVIDTMTVWPIAVVEDGSARACGYLMRAIPDAFLQPIETSSGAERIPREIQQLFVPENIARRNLGETANRIERLALARDMAFALGFLHKRDFVYGDLSYKNAVFCLRPHPSVVLLDCDAIRRVGQTSGVAQLHSPGWKPPEGGPQTKGTDRYKLGLFILRCVTPGVNAQNRDPDKAHGHLDSEGLSLLRRALGDDPEKRTTGKEWVQYFNRQIATSGGVRQRTGTAPGPKKAPVRRAPAPTTVPFAIPARARRSPVIVPAATGSYRGTYPPRHVVTLKPWHAYTSSFGSAMGTNPMDAVRAIAIVIGLSLAGVAAHVGAANAGSSSARKASTSTTAVFTNLPSTTTTADIGSARPTTAFAASAADAGVAAKKYLNAIDQRVVGLSVEPGSYPSSSAPAAWIVHLAASDPDQSSGQPVWTIRNVRVSNGSAFEQAPTTVTSAALPTLAGPAISGLDTAVKNLEPVVPVLSALSWVCNPANSSPACDWRFDIAGQPAYFSGDGTPLAEPPAWAN